jgi:CTP:molybdopterin cytidylyltransferase MocA
VADLPRAVEAVLLAGGKFEHVPQGEEPPRSKGLLPIAGIPMAARTLRALRESPAVSRVILVSSLPAEEHQDSCWRGADQIVAAGERLIDSFKAGVHAVADPTQPAMVVVGDLPLLTAESVTDWLDRCRARHDAAIWYSYMRRNNSEAAFPGVHHTYVPFREGTFCGAGFFMSRPDALTPLYQAMTELTNVRKNPLKLAQLLGWDIIVSLILRRLTVPQAERGMQRLLGGKACAGIESPYPETAFNVDDLETLQEARRFFERGPERRLG